MPAATRARGRRRAAPTLVSRVLVVDDEALIRSSLSETLTDGGHLVTEAADGEAALRTLTDGVPAFDVVLVDYRLPDSNDVAPLSRIRHIAPTTIVIMMTAYSTSELSEDAVQQLSLDALVRGLLSCQPTADRSITEFRNRGMDMVALDVRISDWVQLVRAEYIEMPGLNLTKKQIQRLWNLDEADCDAVLEALIARRFLKPMRGNAYVRVEGPRVASDSRSVESQDAPPELTDFDRSRLQPL